MPRLDALTRRAALGGAAGLAASGRAWAAGTASNSGFDLSKGPHPEVLGAAEPRRTYGAPGASFEASLRGAPQDEEHGKLSKSPGVRLTAAERLGPGASFGFAALDLASGHVTSVDPDRRFPMCSSFKWLLAARVLARVDRGEERLDRFVRYDDGDLIGHAPVTRAHVGEGGLTLEALCAAAIEESDNGAANLILARIGGPAGLTAWLRSVGDATTRLDRNEPTLNEWTPGDPRDTTTPAAMLADLQRLLFGPTLSAASRARLLGWMEASTPGAARLTAGLPPGWRIAHKTGTGDHGATADVGVLIPPSGKPLLVAAYTVGSTKPLPEIEAWFATVARSVTADALIFRNPR